MTTQEQKTPWKRLALEGVVIVFSILLAFALDAWWDQRKHRAEENNQLQALRTELSESLPPLEAILMAIQDIAGKISTLTTLLEEAAGEPVVISGELLGAVITWRTTDVSTSTLDALMASGNLNLLSNVELRAKLAALPATLYDLTEDEKIAQEFVEFHMGPLVAREGLAKIAFANRLDNDGFDFSGEILANPSQLFIEMLYARRVHLGYSELGIPAVQAHVSELIELIDLELAKQR